MLSVFASTLNKDMESVLVRYRHKMELYAGRLHGLSPLQKLSSGYSYVALEDGKQVKSINDVTKDARISISVTDGKITATVEKTEAMNVRTEE